MSQQVFSGDEAANSPVKFMNVPEAWQLYDTVLIGGSFSAVTPNTGYFQGYATVGLQSEIAFFNVRNRAHGMPYNNQDAIGVLPYVFYIYSIGVAFFSPSTSAYTVSVNPPLGEETLVNRLWQTEIPKHISVVLKTNQDERLLTNALMVPPGYGPVGGGIGVGDLETEYGYPNIHHASYTQGESMLINTWGFPTPLAIPRTANISVVLRLNSYCQNMLQQFTGPSHQPMRAVANDTTFFAADGCSGIQVFLKGKREVQQRGQYHA
jgi:hypothetical protein